MGDKVLKVNGVSVIDVDHYTAVEVLKACGSVLVLLVSREVTKLIGQPIYNDDGSVSQVRNITLKIIFKFDYLFVGNLNFISQKV